MVDGLAVHLHLTDISRVDEKQELLLCFLREQEQSRDLEAAARTACHRSEEGQKHYYRLREHRPVVDVSYAEARRRYDRRGVEERLVERIVGGRIERHDIDADYDRRQNDEAEVEPQLLHLCRLQELTRYYQDIHGEIHAEQHHEYRDNRLEIVGVVGGDVRVSHAEAACAGGREAGVYRVKELHAAAEQEDHLQHRQSEVDAVEHSGVVAHLGHRLADDRTRAFGAHEVDILLTAELRDKREQEHDYAHAAQPVHKAAPHQHSVAEPLDLDEDRRSRSGEARDSLKQSVDVVRYLSAEEERHCADKREHDPAQSRRAEACLLVEHHVLRLFHLDGEHAQNRADNARAEEVQRLVFSVNN